MANDLTYTCETSSSDETKALAASLSPYFQAGDAVVLSGDLGAGKTQFVQGIAAGLGIKAQVVSPTFNILLSYGEGRLPLYHFDLYRLDDADQLEDIGYYETLEADGVSFIEWGEKFPEDLPYDYLEIAFFIDNQGMRQIRMHAFGDRARELLDAWMRDGQARMMQTMVGAFWKN